MAGELDLEVRKVFAQIADAWFSLAQNAIEREATAEIAEGSKEAPGSDAI